MNIHIFSITCVFICVWENEKEKSGKSKVFVLHNVLLIFFVLLSCSVNKKSILVIFFILILLNFHFSFFYFLIFPVFFRFSLNE